MVGALGGETRTKRTLSESVQDSRWFCFGFSLCCGLPGREEGGGCRVGSTERARTGGRGQVLNGVGETCVRRNGRKLVRRSELNLCREGIEEGERLGCRERTVLD